MMHAKSLHKIYQFITILSGISFTSLINAQEYANCLLKHASGMSDSRAVSVIERACFETTQHIIRLDNKELDNIKLYITRVKVTIGHIAGTENWHTIEVTNNTNYRITKIYILVKDKNHERLIDINTNKYTDYVGIDELHIRPREVKSYLINLTDFDSQFQFWWVEAWGISYLR
jgi:ribosomal protein S13